MQEVEQKGINYYMLKDQMNRLLLEFAIDELFANGSISQRLLSRGS